MRRSARTPPGLFAEAALGACAALVPEPCLPDGSIKTSRKGVSTYELDVHGRAAHAGVEPDRAVSVARELIQLLPAIYALEDRAAGTQVNVGVIQAGTASNVVPAHARLWLDIRVSRTLQRTNACTARPGVAAAGASRGEARSAADRDARTTRAHARHREALRAGA
jgi:glutamate carboxypeptidase